MTDVTAADTSATTSLSATASPTPEAAVIAPADHAEAKEVHRGLLAKFDGLADEVAADVKADLTKLATLLHL